MSIHSLYKEILPPTVVEHVVECNFTNGRERNLIISRSSILEIYRLVEEAENDLCVRMLMKRIKTIILGFNLMMLRIR
jgi:hypothetical protein